MADAERADRFFGREWPEVAAVADPEPRLALYEAFGLTRAPWTEVLRPAVLAAGTASLLRAGMGKPHGDLQRNPGAFLVRGAEVCWSHDFRHWGDHPDPARVVEQARNIL